MATPSSNKNGYEAIPDVEKAEGEGVKLSPQEQYPGFNDDQLDLMVSFDKAIESAHVDLSLPKIDPEDMASKGKNFIMGLITPTLTAACTMAMAWYLTAQDKAAAGSSMLHQVAVILFPYVNATLQFLASFGPIKERLMDAVVPVFERKDKLQGTVESNMDDITKHVDTTLDSIQAKLNKVIDPMKPTLDKASSQADILKKFDPDLDIPDVSDFDREFDEAQGKVGEKVVEAKQHLELDQYVPKPVRSADSFYWSIVFPVVVVALAVQLAIAFATTYSSQQQSGALSSFNTTGIVVNGKVFDINTTGYQEQVAAAAAMANQYKDQAMDTVNQYKDQASESVNKYKDEALSTAKQYKDKASSTASHYKEKASSTAKQYMDEFNTTVSEYKDQLNGYEAQASAAAADTAATANQYKDESTDTVNQYKDQASETANQYKDEALNAANQYKDEALSTANQYMDEFNSTFNQYKDQLNGYEEQANAAIADSKSLIMNVISSYLMAALQLALVYVFTNQAIKAWVMNKAVEQVTEGANRTLREYGVTHVLEDVLATRMSRIRNKILKVLKIYTKIESVMEKVSGIPMVGDLASKISLPPALEDLKEGKRPSFLGRFMGGDDKK